MIWIAGIVGVAIVAGTAWGPIVSQNVEQAKYTIVTKSNAIEVRKYAPMIVAETHVSGERKEAINQGFRQIADYIFGNNTARQKVAMTTPVIQQSSEKIAMTAPVTQQNDGKNWKVSFGMPANYTMETLPLPNNDTVKLVELPARQFVAITFSGTADKEKIAEQTMLLNNYIHDNHLHSLSSPIYAFFNPPWTLPFLRRNEVMIDISED